MASLVSINDQPISSTFFGEGKWLTEFITPKNGDVERLASLITDGEPDKASRARDAWYWVAHNVRYVPFVKATLTIEGKTSYQRDYWGDPSLTIHTLVGNCANKAFLLASLLRTFMDEGSVRCVLGNLCQNGQCGGHAWVQVRGEDKDYIMEATRDDLPPFIPADIPIYDPVVYFNDQKVDVVQGKTLLVPFSAVYADWLKDYLNQRYLEGGL